MRLQNQLVRMTQKALDDLIRAVEAMPEDKLDWSPAPTSRSALNQLKEVAVSTRYLCGLLREGKAPDGESHGAASVGAQMGEITTVSQAKERAREGTAELCSLIVAYPDDKLDEDVVLPFGGGIRMTMADCLGLHYWNLTYHCGQVNYVQTILGDLRMH